MWRRTSSLHIPGYLISPLTGWPIKISSVCFSAFQRDIKKWGAILVFIIYFNCDILQCYVFCVNLYYKCKNVHFEYSGWVSFLHVFFSPLLHCLNSISKFLFTIIRNRLHCPQSIFFCKIIVFTSYLLFHTHFISPTNHLPKFT